MTILAESDLKNLRFYATMFREHQWETPWIHWGVFEQTLNEIADRVQELEKRHREEFAARDRYKAQSNSWRDKAFELQEYSESLKNALRDALDVVEISGKWLRDGEPKAAENEDAAKVCDEVIAFAP